MQMQMIFVHVDKPVNVCL